VTARRPKQGLGWVVFLDVYGFAAMLHETEAPEELLKNLSDAHTYVDTHLDSHRNSFVKFAFFRHALALLSCQDDHGQG
jgi:hypothetical protein